MFSEYLYCLDPEYIEVIIAKHDIKVMWSALCMFGRLTNKSILLINASNHLLFAVSWGNLCFEKCECTFPA